MGHCEMLLAVAGLSETERKERTRRLAEEDWSSFRPTEAVAFSFAVWLTAAPDRAAEKAVPTLVEACGPHRALDVIWHSAWCNYMTRVADAFQLPLESENVFAPPAPAERPPKDRPSSTGAAVAPKP